MMTLEKKISLLAKLSDYIQSEEEDWQNIQYQAMNANAWFTMDNINHALRNISEQFLQKHLLEAWVEYYSLNNPSKKIGVIMAGNIPLVGFHDFLCCFISGHETHIKLSSKDEVLLKHLIGKLYDWDAEVKNQIFIAEQLKGCNAYIATGSNNSSRYFEQYFGKQPNIIRKNRTSVAILEGDETEDELRLLSEDVFRYFGLGCRNVTQIYVPEHYNFKTLLDVFEEQKDIIHHHKYKNNYDYHLAVYLLNKVPMFTNEMVLLVGNEIPFSPVSVLHFSYYKDIQKLARSLDNNENIQTVVGRGFTPFGTSQQPALNDYADGVDTLLFLTAL